MSDTPKLNEAADGGLRLTPCCASWIPGDKPDTRKGSSTLMWVTMRHKESGKLTVGVLTYHNGHVMPCSDQCDPPDCAVPHNPEEDGYCEEYEWTCWSDGYCEHCETEWVWSSHYTEIVAHALVTKPEPFLHNEKAQTRAQLNKPMPTSTDCRKCGRSYYGTAGLLCDECDSDASALRSAAACSPSSDRPEDDDLLMIAWMHGAAARKEQCRKLARERDAYRDALKQIEALHVWHDPEEGFMSGHIATGVLNQFPENSKITSQ